MIFLHQVRLVSFLLFIFIFIIKLSKCKEIEVLVGTNITIECKSTADEIIWWTLNGKNLTIDSKRLTTTSPLKKFNEDDNSEISSQPSLHSLTISKLKISDEGNYTCHSLYADKSGLNTTRILPIIEPHVVKSSPSIIKVKMGPKISIHCLIEAFPTAKFMDNVKWRKNDVELDVNTYKVKVEVLNKTIINTTLEIDQVMKRDNGTFYCLTNPNATQDIKTEISILVLDAPQVIIDYVKAVATDKIFLNWTVNDGNEPVEKYFVQYLQEDQTTFTYYNHVIDGKNLSFVLNHFLPKTKYQLKMSGKNKIGDGPIYTYNQWIRTLEADPIFTPLVETTGSSSSTITIGWQPPPADLLEYIQYYELVVFETDDNNRKIVEEAIYQQNSRNLPYMFDNLKTATVYEFKVRACSDLSKICGPWSEIVNGTTMDGMASKPHNLKISCSHFNISRRNSVAVTWEPPKIPNGKVISYLIQLDGIATYRTDGKYMNDTWGPKVRSIDEPNHKIIYEGVHPNTNYTVTVSGRTRNKKIGEAGTATCTMPVTVPDNIERIVWNKIKTGNNKYVFKMILPKISERNGEICCYRIYLVRMGANNKDLPSLPEDMHISNYNEVHDVNNTHGGAYLAEMLAGNFYKSEIFLGDDKRSFPDDQSKIQSDEICRKCVRGLPPRKIIKKVINVISTTTYKPEGLSNFSKQLEKAGNFTEDSSKILANRRRRRKRVAKLIDEERHDLNKNYIETTVSPDLDYNSVNYQILDGEIDFDSNYTGFLEVIVRGDNDKDVLSAFSSYFDVISPKASAENMNKSDNMTLVLNIVAQVLCALILLVILLLAALCFMHRYYSKTAAQGDEVISLRDSLSRALWGGRTSNHRHIIGSALSKPADVGPISKNDLPQAYVNRHKDTDYGFLREYEMLPNRFNDRTTKNSDLKENAHKNRYPDIKAYDQTRVKLSFINSLQGSDYINANFVIGYKERKKFICSQGPMENTISDFWRMVWEQHLEIIVMLTNIEEYNKAKCAKYWPEKLLDSKQFGEISVTFANENRFSDYLVRQLDVSKKNSNENDEEEHRQITQYHYLVWKDFMAPEHPYGIIKFIRQINWDYSVQRGPILVHCSAGVGRTGTLVALDSLMQQLEDEGQVSIFNTVCDLRHQRNYLVQSLKQYIFLYRALLDISQFGNTEIQAKSLSSTIENLKTKPNDSKEKCKLEFEFDKIQSVLDETNKNCLVGCETENINKNRSESVIPYDRNRVILTPIPIKEHSTYINASFIEGYENSESFIITQDPLENTIFDFWRMISEQGATTLIMISEIGDGQKKCPRYWADDEVQYEHILVKYMSSDIGPYYTRREFNVTNCKIDDTIKVTQFQYNGWPTVEGEVPEVCRGIIELVDQAQKHHLVEKTLCSRNPMVVHCNLGTDKSSIFIAMSILVKQLRTEKKIDVCTIARKLRSQRPYLLNAYAQYEFLHRAIANYADLHQLSEESSNS